MSNKISTDAQATEVDIENPVLVQLRLAPALADKLRKEGSPYRRKLPAQIIHLLNEPQAAGSADAFLFGWVDPERNKTLGEAIGILAGRLDVAGPMTEDRVRDRAGVLAMLKIAVADVLDRLGADESALSADERNFAALEARKFTNELHRPERSRLSIGPRPDLDVLAKVAAAEPMSPRSDSGG